MGALLCDELYGESYDILSTDTLRKRDGTYNEQLQHFLGKYFGKL